MRQKALKPMKVVFRSQKEPRSTPLARAFRALGVRFKWALDDTAIAVCRGKRRKGDHMYPHSPERVGVYFERPTIGRFHNRAKAITKLLAGVKGVEYNLGDLDGIITFPWDAAVRLREFFKDKRVRRR
jgi:hypothetical protein